MFLPSLYIPLHWESQIPIVDLHRRCRKDIVLIRRLVTGFLTKVLLKLMKKKQKLETVSCIDQETVMKDSSNKKSRT